MAKNHVTDNYLKSKILWKVGNIHTESKKDLLFDCSHIQTLAAQSQQIMIRCLVAKLYCKQHRYADTLELKRALKEARKINAPKDKDLCLSKIAKVKARTDRLSPEEAVEIAKEITDPLIKIDTLCVVAKAQHSHRIDVTDIIDTAQEIVTNAINDPQMSFDALITIASVQRLIDPAAAVHTLQDAIAQLDQVADPYARASGLVKLADLQMSVSPEQVNRNLTEALKIVREAVANDPETIKKKCKTLTEIAKRIAGKNLTLAREIADQAIAIANLCGVDAKRHRCLIDLSKTLSSVFPELAADIFTQVIRESNKQKIKDKAGMGLAELQIQTDIEKAKNTTRTIKDPYYKALMTCKIARKLYHG